MKILIGAAVGTLLIITVMYERMLGKVVKDNESLWKKLLHERKKSFQLKRQIEYYNIFLKEMKMITKENNYGSVKNLENKIRSAIEDINKAEAYLKRTGSEQGGD